MNKKMCVLYVLLSVFAVADPGSCEGLSKLDKLACQKSVHKQSVKNRRADKTINTAAEIRGSEKVGSKNSSKSSSRNGSRNNKVRLPHNRKMSASSSTPFKFAKKKTKQNTNVPGLKVSGQQGRSNLDHDLAVSRSELLSSDSATDASETVKVPVVNSNMLSSQLSYGSDKGVGDDALYRIY